MDLIKSFYMRMLTQSIHGLLRYVPIWWTLYGPSIKILPESYKKLYLEWVEVIQKIIPSHYLPWLISPFEIIFF
ncbi:hypothetical protein H5410_062860 [Solanum commersonii]|uniref:Uncharacterized protein n=1 Tax=Solanum commersonii TaxID=4109 RepID=A0A9J5WDY4_SOLCO|nr:hypothetical protein H5410_062860 [Solanum commersonii]